MLCGRPDVRRSYVVQAKLELSKVRSSGSVHALLCSRGQSPRPLREGTPAG